MLPKQPKENSSVKQKVDFLLDALQSGQEGVEIVAQALDDRAREVRQSAFLLLCDSNEDIARQAVWSYIPFANMQCLYTLTQFNLDCYDPERFHPEYFAIADYNNTLLCYWNLTYKHSSVNVWNLETGQRKIDFVLSNAHEFGLGKQGRVCIVNYQHLLWALDTETQKHIGTYPDYFISVKEPGSHWFAVCPAQKPLVALGCTHSEIVEFEIWDYESYTRHLDYGSEGMVLGSRGSISPLIFTPDGKFLIVHFFKLYSQNNSQFLKQKKSNVVQVWETETGELIQTIDNLPALTITALATDSSGEILACGTREGQVCVWKLMSDEILHSFSEVSPCLMSANGRVLIFCTNSYEIIVWDLATNKKLCSLQGHSSPISHIAMSNDREFIASYSIDRTIKIWGVPEPIYPL